MDEQNKEVTNKIEELEEKVEKVEAAENKSFDSSTFLLVMAILLLVGLIGLLIWDTHNDHTIDKQKARIEELEEKLNYKTTVEIGPLPCPFCGSELVETMYGRYEGGWYVHCEECGGRTGRPDSLLHDDEVTLSEAVNMWNKMAGMEVREQLEQETEEE